MESSAIRIGTFFLVRLQSGLRIDVTHDLLEVENNDQLPVLLDNTGGHTLIRGGNRHVGLNNISPGNTVYSQDGFYVESNVQLIKVSHNEKT